MEHVRLTFGRAPAWAAPRPEAEVLSALEVEFRAARDGDEPAAQGEAREGVTGDVAMTEASEGGSSGSETEMEE